METIVEIIPSRIPKANSIIELLAEIEKRPAMFTGKPHISLLRAFLDGWSFARYQPDMIADEEIMGEFQKWIEKKYHSKTTHGWHQIILYYSEDERTALTEFFKLFNEFLARAKK